MLALNMHLQMRLLETLTSAFELKERGKETSRQHEHPMSITTAITIAITIAMSSLN